MNKPLGRSLCATPSVVSREPPRMGQGIEMRVGVVLPGTGATWNYELVHDPDTDELTLWIGDLLVAHVDHGAKNQIEYLSAPPEKPDGIQGVYLPSVSDPECGFTVAVDGHWFLLLDSKLNALSWLEEASTVVEFLADATTGGGLV